MKYNKFLILLLIFQTTYVFSDISVQQAAQAIINKDYQIISQYAQQGGDFTAEVPEYNDYNLLELALITVNPVIIDFILKQGPFIKPDSLDFIIAPLSFYNFNPNYNRQDQINIILKLLYSGFIRISVDNILDAIDQPEILDIITNLYFGGNTVLSNNLNEIIQYVLDQDINDLNLDLKKSIKILLKNGADINVFFTKVLEYHESIIENQTHLLELPYLYDLLTLLIEFDIELFNSQDITKNLYNYIDTINEYTENFLILTKDYIKEIIGIFIHEANLDIKDIFNYILEKNNKVLIQILLEMGVKVPKFSTENKSTQTEDF